MGSIKLTVTGASGAGKTTLAGRLAEELGLPLIPEIARIHCAELGYERIGEIPDQENFKRQVLERQIEAEAAHESFVADRSVLDTWVLWQRWNICSAMTYDTEAIYNRVAAHATLYTRIIYLPPSFPAEEDGFRWTEPDYIKQIDRIFRMTFFDLRMQDRVLTLQSNTIEERLDEAKKLLAALLPCLLFLVFLLFQPAADAARDIKIISIAPSNTELVYSLNAGKQLYAVSDICDYPPEARSKPRVGNLSSLKMEKIAGLKPDLILLVSGQESLAHNLKKHGFNTLLLDNSSINNIGKNLRDIAKSCNREKQANALAIAFEKSIADLKALTAQDKKKSRVFVCVWPQPLMSAGKDSFISEGVTIAGGINCTADMPQAYPRVNQEKLILLQPDIVLVPAEQGRDKFWTRTPWTSLKAVKENRVLVLPQHETDCLTRPTLRFIDALYWLAIKLHPDLKSKIDNWHADSVKQLSAIH